jgi:hypothetical protein
MKLRLMTPAATTAAVKSSATAALKSSAAK